MAANPYLDPGVGGFDAMDSALGGTGALPAASAKSEAATGLFEHTRGHNEQAPPDAPQADPKTAPPGGQPPVSVEGTEPVAEASVAQILSGGKADPNELPKDEADLLNRYGLRSKELADILRNKYGPEADAMIAKMNAKLEAGGPKTPAMEKPPTFEAYKPDAGTWRNFGLALGGLMLIFGGAGGGRAAMAAATGAMKGFHEGNLQKAEEHRKDFNEKMEEVHARNASIQQEYQNALGQYKDDLNGLQAQLGMIATKYKIPILAKQTEMGQIDQALKVMDGHWRAAQNLIMQQQKINNAVEMLQFKKSIGGLSTSQIRENETIVKARDQFLAMKPEEKAKVLADGRSPISLNSPQAKIFRLMTKSLYGGDPAYASINSYGAQAGAEQINQFPWTRENSQEIQGAMSSRTQAAGSSSSAGAPTPPTQGQPGASGTIPDGATATGPNGQKVIRKGGQWVPMPQGSPVMQNAQPQPTAG